jgi:hypothetical protein
MSVSGSSAAVAWQWGRASNSRSVTVTVVPSPPLMRSSIAYRPPICSRRTRTTLCSWMSSVVSLRSAGNWLAFSRHRP